MSELLYFISHQSSYLGGVKLAEFKSLVQKFGAKLVERQNFGAKLVRKATVKGVKSFPEHSTMRIRSTFRIAHKGI